MKTLAQIIQENEVLLHYEGELDPETMETDGESYMLAVNRHIVRIDEAKDNMYDICIDFIHARTCNEEDLQYYIDRYTK